MARTIRRYLTREPWHTLTVFAIFVAYFQFR